MTPTLQDRALKAMDEIQTNVFKNVAGSYTVSSTTLAALWVQDNWETIREALRLAADPDWVYVPRIEMLNRDAWLDMVRLLLPLAKGYVYANAGIRSTECIIEDAEAMIAAAPVATTEG